MNYEQKYKEALEKARQFSEHPLQEDSSSIVEYIFPELAESEGERIRKALIRFHKSTIDVDGIKGEDIISWLEKQGNNLVENGYTDNKDIIKYADNYSHEIWRKLMDNFENIQDYHIGCNDVSDIVLNAIIDAYNWLEKQGAQKPANKVKPKFKVGDWVVDEHGDCFIINSIERGFYFTQLSGCCYQTPIDIDLVDNSYHAWTIEDAKDGDVLYYKGENNIEYIVMNKGINMYHNVDSYFRYNSIDGFAIDIPSVLSAENDGITPATNAQCALLFQKTKEAGYEWDANKKELKKVEEGKASFANRQLYNRAILKLLSDYIEKYPDIRFGQMLCNLDVKPHFDEESRKTYCNLNETINKKS